MIKKPNQSIGESQSKKWTGSITKKNLKNLDSDGIIHYINLFSFADEFSSGDLDENIPILNENRNIHDNIVKS